MREIYHRYSRASSRSKQSILDEFWTNCGYYHRKHAIRLLNGPALKPSPTSAPQTACDLWTCSDLGARCDVGSGRLFLLGPSEGVAPGVDALGSETISLDAPTGQQLIRLSPRTLDYRLRPKKRQLKKRIYGRTKPGTLYCSP